MRTYKEASPDVLRSTTGKSIAEIDSKQRGRMTKRGRAEELEEYHGNRRLL